MITVMETQDEDSFLLIAQTVANLLNDGQLKSELADLQTTGSGFLSDVTTLVGEARYEEYFLRMVPHIDLVYKQCSDKEAECIVNLLIHALARLSEDRLAENALVLASALTKGEDHADERLAGVLNLYGVVPSARAQYALLLRASEFARGGARTAKMLSAAVQGKADRWVREWGLSAAESGALYLSFALLFKAVNDKASIKEYMKLITLALNLTPESDAAALAAIRPHAATAAGDFIRSPYIYQCDLTEAPAVRQLATDPAYSGLHKLLTVMLAGDITGFRTAASPAVLEQLGVSLETALSKARMVALLALGCRAGHDELSFSAISAALDVPLEKVETWIIRAIGAKLLEGKIDQVRSCLSLSRCTHQTFGAKQWTDLRSQLAAWKENLAGVSSTISSVQPPANALVRAAAAASAVRA
ncbi:MAG: hypothetical protein WDW36_008336 [Sanguina aurantia]